MPVILQIAYTSPLATSVKPTSLPAAAEGIVTVSGVGFGPWDTSPKARLLGTACSRYAQSF